METALSRGGVSLGSLKADYALRRTGNERMRWPVAEYIALVSAGITGGSAGSPRPVGGLSDLSQAMSISGAMGMRAQRPVR